MAYGRNLRNRRLRHKLELQKREPTTAGYEPSAAFQTYAEVWAEKRDPRGAEVSAGLQADAVMTIVFRIHYRAGVTPEHRVLFGDRKLDIRAVTNPDGWDRWLLLHCVEHSSGGD